MMIPRRFAFLTFFVAIICALCSTPSLAKQGGQIDLVDVPDPGAAPPFVASEYDPYFRNGKGTLVAPFMLKRRDGSYDLCETNVATSFLYPDTAYVRWALQKWAFLKKTHWYKPYVATIGPDKNSGFSDMPDYLNPFTQKASVVRMASCDQTHHSRFQNLPAGSYIFWGIVDSRILGSGVETHQSANLDPITGVVNVNSVNVPMHNDKVVDNYFFFSRAITVKDGETYTMYQSAIQPFAYER